MGSFLKTAIANMSTEDKNKLGRTGSKINTEGSHLVTITGCYEGDYEGAPNFNLTFEDTQGKKAEAKLYLTSKVGKDDKTGEVRAGMYSVNGVQTQLNNEGDVHDNLKAIGQIRNLWKICGLDEDKFGEGTAQGTVKAYGKDITAEIWNGLVGKQLTIITSFEVSADKKDPKKTWKNQKVSISNLFNAVGLSQFEIDEGKTEPKAIEAAVRLAKAPAEKYADIGYAIKYSDKANKSCIQELKLIAGAGKVPSTQSINTPVDGDADPF